MAYRLLIVDDDPDFYRLVERELVDSAISISIDHAEDAVRARELIQSKDYDAWIVDCLLPGESGVDLLKHFKSKIAIKILVSGIFTDAGFIDQSLKDSGARYFLTKPVDLKALRQYLKIDIISKKNKAEEIEDPAFESSIHFKKSDHIYGAFGFSDRSPRRVKKIFDSLEVIHGFDLPLAYQLITEAKLSGYLNLQPYGDGSAVFGITFSQGRIINVDIGDSQSYLGKILVENEFLLSADLESALQLKNDMKLGEYLLQNYLLSPHALQLALSEQMSVRLSKTIQDEFFKLNFVPDELTSSDVFVSEELLDKYLHDWILSKLSNDWIFMRFSSWYFAAIRLSDKATYQLERIRHLPLLQQFEGFETHLLSSPTFSDVWNRPDQDPLLLKYLFFLLIKGVIYFESYNLLGNPKAILTFQSVMRALERGDLYKVVGELGFTTQQLSTCRQILFQFSSSFETIDDGDFIKQVESFKSRVRAISQQTAGGHNDFMDEKRNREIVLAEALSALEQARKSLFSGKNAEALKLLSPFIQQGVQLPGLTLHYLWAKITTASSPQDLKEFEKTWLRVPPEEKHDALYFFVQAVYYRVSGKKELATKSLEKAIQLDRDFMPARRELIQLQSGTKAAGTMPPSDSGKEVKGIIAQLFKKKQDRSP